MPITVRSTGTTAVVAAAAILIVAASLTRGAAAANKPDPIGFALNNKPIHPLSVAPLLEDLGSHDARIAAVDLEGSGASGSHQVKMTVRGDFVSSSDGSGGWVAYRHLGTTPDGLHVLVTQVNGGGSGVFEDVVWVRLMKDQVWEDGKKRDRTMLLRVGSFTLGDRDDGDVKLDGAKLFVGKSRYRQKDTTIPLD